MNMLPSVDIHYAIYLIKGEPIELNDLVRVNLTDGKAYKCERVLDQNFVGVANNTQPDDIYVSVRINGTINATKRN